MPPLKDDNGFFRVDGFLCSLKNLLGKKSRFQHLLSEVSKCSNKVGDTCAKPQIWIAQEKDELDNRIRVADMERKKLRRFKVGKKYVFTGELSQTSKSGLADSRGILRGLKNTKELNNHFCSLLTFKSYLTNFRCICFDAFRSCLQIQKNLRTVFCCLALLSLMIACGDVISRN